MSTDDRLRDGPWLAPVDVELVKIRPTILDSGEAGYGILSRLDREPVRMGVACGALLPRWWVNEWKEHDRDDYEEMASIALKADVGPMLSFQRRAEGYVGERRLPGWGRRRTRERRALDPSQAERLVNPQGLLDEFVALEGEPAEAYREFARNFGLLWLCQRHARPFRYCQVYGGENGCGLLHAEPILHWRFAVEFISSVLRINRVLSEETEDELDNRDLAVATGQSPGAVRESRSYYSQHSAVDWDVFGDLERELERWLRFGDVKLRIRLRPGTGPAIEEAGDLLFGALAKRLAYSLVGAEQRVPCYECGRLHVPYHKPRAGRDSFCRKCRERGAPQKHASRRRRRRLRRLHQIVDELGGAPAEEDEAHRFWNDVQVKWRRLNLLEKTPEQLREDFYKSLAD